jgi:hypothetical protein
MDYRREADKSLRERVKTPKEERHFDWKTEKPDEAPNEAETIKRKRRKAPIGTRMTMTSRVGYFQDRIISPSMVSQDVMARELMIDASYGHSIHWSTP